MEICGCAEMETDYIADQATSISLNSTFRGSSDNNADLVLKPAPKPQLQSGSRAENLLGIGSLDFDGSKTISNSDDEHNENDEEEKRKVIDSFGEALEKAEKLETSRKVSVSINRSTADRVTDKNDSKPVNSLSSSNRKSKKMKSVWRKGNPVATVQKVVDHKQKALSDGSGKAESQTVTPLGAPEPRLKIQPTLQAKPSVSPFPLAKKPVILMDVGAAPKPSCSAMTDSSAKTKERKPMLLDKFASKRPVVDPLVAQAVVAPSKPAKGHAPGKSKEDKSKDDFRKKGIPSGGQRKRMVDAVEISDEEMPEIDVSIPGAATTRKRRKWTKASRKAARIQAAIDAAPVKVEILEVGDGGMRIEGMRKRTKL